MNILSQGASEVWRISVLVSIVEPLEERALSKGYWHIVVLFNIAIYYLNEFLMFEFLTCWSVTDGQYHNLSWERTLQIAKTCLSSFKSFRLQVKFSNFGLFLQVGFDYAEPSMATLLWEKSTSVSRFQRLVGDDIWFGSCK